MTNLLDASLWKSGPTKVVVLVPCRDTVTTYFTQCLVEMVKTSMLSGIDVKVIYDQSTILLSQRENLAYKAIESGTNYALYLDSDMMFPETTILRMISHNLPVVCANYMKRSVPLQTVGYKKVGDWNSWVPLDYEEELVEVEGIGMGCFMIKPEILFDIKKPFFEFEYKDNEWHGEDFNFQRKLRNAGHKIMIDQNLSRQIRHVGQWAYGPSIQTNQEKIKKVKRGK